MKQDKKGLPGTWRPCKIRSGAPIITCPDCCTGQYLTKGMFIKTGESKEPIACLNVECEFEEVIKLLDWR
jgi:hypothetical protein